MDEEQTVQSGSCRVLVVDDEPSIRIATTRILQRAGYRVESAADGREALAKAAEFDPDIILLDIMLPGGASGIDVCRMVCGRAGAPRIVVMMTAVADKPVVVQAAEAGAAGYLIKPFQSAALLEKLEKLRRGEKTPLLDAAASPKSGAPRIIHPKQNAQLRLARRGSGLAASVLKNRDGPSGGREETG